MAKLHEMILTGAVIFADKETDITITWDGSICFTIYAGKFDGDYDNIDSFYREVTSLQAAQQVAKMWFQEHSTFNPGP